MGRLSIILIATVVFALGLFGPSLADDPTLSPKQLQELRLLSIPVLLPTYIPAGFHLDPDQFKAKRSAAGDHYELRYCGPANSEFRISVAVKDSGSLERDVVSDWGSFRRPYIVDSPLIGSVQMHPGKNGAYFSDYLGLDRLGNPKALLVFRGNVPSDEIQKIYGSLQLLKR
jgi:hypothetical protein